MTAKQARIVEAAVQMFAEKGYAATSTSEIAKQAGVAEGTIFRHYRTKKDLLMAIAAPAAVKLLAPFLIREFRGVLNAEYSSFEQFLRAVVDNRLRFVERNMSMVRIVIQEMPFHPDLQNRFREAVLSPVLERIGGILDRFKAMGQLADLPNGTIARICASAMMGYVAARLLNRPSPNWNDEKELEATIAFLLKGLAP
ncbi:TetR/AcrR family transcriptional regulator [Cohnella sp. CBP 2801]|uniref:TetR/AcrR family transcriptional regulator n=2 Tax=Cohnella zeiphila TaxID=2761120 RepID=A0A7X0SJX5_9BACL|nr:TetR/AcrR family transcriptional regulator [Cohnella zeiphila]MBB6731329.1 TetR/AcrR family transcriptional regulator [Cohnella zeiphila]